MPRLRARADLTDLAVSVVAVALVVVPILVVDPPAGPAALAGFACWVAAAALLGLWRRRPVLVGALGAALLTGALLLGAPDPPAVTFVVLLGYAAVAGERFHGRAAWIAGGCVLGYVVLIYVVTGESGAGPPMLILPGYVAGTALRWRRRAAEDLAERGRELDRERELYTALAVRHERARIAAELHDIVGHAVSVMVVQAAAGQRLVDRDPEAAREALAVVGDAAGRGRADLHRLLRLLDGEPDSPDGPDTSGIAVVPELVDAAAGAGLCVSYRVEGEAGDVDEADAHLALRVVQESLTNALRHSPGSAVRVVLAHRRDPPALSVRVENDRAPGGPGPGLRGTGRGLDGLRTRVLDGGGTFAAGPVDDGGWRVEVGLRPREQKIVP